MLPAPALARRFALTLSLLTLSLFGPARASGQACAPPGPCEPSLVFKAAREQGTYLPNEGLVYDLTVENTGSTPIEEIVLYGPVESPISTGSNPRCAADNRSWTMVPRNGVESWRRKVGLLRGGERLSFKFCIQVKPLARLSCDFAQSFRASIFNPGEGSDSDIPILTKEAYVTSRRQDCEPRSCATHDPRCCVAEVLFCFLNPGEDNCRGVAPAGTPGFASRLWQAGATVASRFFDTFDDLALLYVLRDGPLAATPGGRRAIALYAEHGPELKRLLLADAALRDQAIDVLTEWRPLLQALVAGGDEATSITAGQISGLEGFLHALAVAGSPTLRGAIERERVSIDLSSVAGLTATQGLARLDRLSCVPDAKVLCLGGGRYRVEAEWQTPDGLGGPGRALALTADTGLFWFFDPANVETVVKLIDGCPLNRRRWVFAAGLTNVGVVTTVSDTSTGAVRTYENPLNRRFQPVQDTAAFLCE